jgi:hypothetical protein
MERERERQSKALLDDSNVFLDVRLDLKFRVITPATHLITYMMQLIALEMLDAVL